MINKIQVLFKVSCYLKKENNTILLCELIIPRLQTTKLYINNIFINSRFDYNLLLKN